MPRRRTKLQYITDDSSRRATFRKRKVGLAKKLSEISIRCGLKACAIVYPPSGNEVEVWPQDPESFHKVLQEYQTISQQKKKEVDLPAFIKQMIEKSQERLKKQTVENDMKEIAVEMNELLGGGGSVASTSLPYPNIMNFDNMISWIDVQMKAVAKKIEKMDIAEAECYVPVPPPPTEAEIEPCVPEPPTYDHK